jgi:hypothetical protein
MIPNMQNHSREKHEELFAMSSIADTIQNLFIVRSDPNLKLNLSFSFAIGMQITLREYLEMRC